MEELTSCRRTMVRPYGNGLDTLWPGNWVAQRPQHYDFDQCKWVDGQSEQELDFAEERRTYGWFLMLVLMMSAAVIKIYNECSQSTPEELASNNGLVIFLLIIAALIAVIKFCNWCSRGTPEEHGGNHGLAIMWLIIVALGMWAGC